MLAYSRRMGSIRGIAEEDERVASVAENFLDEAQISFSSHLPVQADSEAVLNPVVDARLEISP